MRGSFLALTAPTGGMLSVVQAMIFLGMVGILEFVDFFNASASIALVPNFIKQKTI